MQEVTLPLRHEDIIRQQARDKGLDPALIAGVIYAESRFRDQTSAAGAEGPDAAHARDRGLHRPQVGWHGFVQGDLATPQVNIAYGSWYLRYLLSKYDGNELLALAAYNAGRGPSTAGARGQRPRGDFRAADAHPVPRDARLRRAGARRARALPARVSARAGALSRNQRRSRSRSSLRPIS